VFYIERMEAFWRCNRFRTWFVFWSHV